MFDDIGTLQRNLGDVFKDDTTTFPLTEAYFVPQLNMMVLLHFLDNMIY